MSLSMILSILAKQVNSQVAWLLLQAVQPKQRRCKALRGPRSHRSLRVTLTL
jgi:hypothetical protein